MSAPERGNDDREVATRVVIALRQLFAAMDDDWTAAAWYLERTDPVDWGRWHETCMPGIMPPDPLRLGTHHVTAITRDLERLIPNRWKERCRVCGQYLDAPPPPKR